MVTLSHLIHVNKLLIAKKPIRGLPTPAAAINEQKPVFTAGIPFLFTPVLSHFFPPSPSPQLLQPRLGDMKFIFIINFHWTSLISLFQAMLLVQILTCQGINREQMIKRTYVTLFISFPLLSILGVFHRSRVLCPPFLSRWFLNITIYLEKFKTKNNFCECQNNLYVKKLSGLFCLKTFI